MHREALERWPKLLSRWDKPYAPSVLDVGSYNVNGCLRPLVEGLAGWKYLGLDLEDGPNVDIVSKDPYNFPFKNNTFDVVISSSTMEHVQAIWLWIPELVRVLKPGGMLAIITHTYWSYHPHPVDCWRIMPDGMRFLFDETKSLEKYSIKMYCHTDISATAFKLEK